MVMVFPAYSREFPTVYLFNYNIPLNQEPSTAESVTLQSASEEEQFCKRPLCVCWYLVTEQDVYACRTLSVHLVDRSQGKAAHTRHLADQFCSCELL